MTPFQAAVYRIVSRIPAGSVTSYGAVAAMAGQPRAARGVGWILNRLPPGSELPWWRVVGGSGALSTWKLPGGTGPLQRALLESEGVVFDADGRVGGEEVWWRPEPDAAARDDFRVL
jgi:methylated-DNA-protein-cysteine methyltransferase-like protein